MKRISLLFFATLILHGMHSCSRAEHRGAKAESYYQDVAFLQDYSIRYYCNSSRELINVAADRNGYIQILSSDGLLRPVSGQFLFPGTLAEDSHYLPVKNKNIRAMCIYKEQLVYADDKAVLSNAWAGKLYIPHSLGAVRIAEGGRNFSFMISDGRDIQLLNGSGVMWQGELPGNEILDIQADTLNNLFWILGSGSLNVFYADDKKLRTVTENSSINTISLAGDKLVAGTSAGYLEFNRETQEQSGVIHDKMPWPEITSVAGIKGNTWFGTKRGAMMLRKDGKFNYYSSERWLPSDTVTDIAPGPGNSVLILTVRGLAKICFDSITLYDKAMYYEKQVRERHIRNGFNATLSRMKKGDVTTGSLEDSDNDGLWTSMYLAAETFRYAVERSEDALQNVRESLDAMERLYTVTPVAGFPARSFERRGYKYHDPAWRRASDPEWDWKSTTSSDEAIGHIFAFGVIAELVDDAPIRSKAIMLIDTLMSHVLRNDFYLIDWDGKPTRWGRWNPEYVNAFPEMVGDRKLNASNITGMLQTAWKFTGKEKYRKAAFYLLDEHYYLQNLMKPIREVGVAPDSSDDLSRLLSEGWNHSDDEMYYCGYWGLYRYAFNDTLREKFRQSILDHWEAERPEKDGLWNIMTAMTGTKDFDLGEAIWYLQEYPVDMITWKVSNSHRKDIESAEPDFRDQTIKEVLPPDELRIARHNANRFQLDGNGNGTSEMSAGDIWLLPYWMGRYLGVISAPYVR